MCPSPPLVRLSRFQAADKDMDFGIEVEHEIGIMRAKRCSFEGGHEEEEGEGSAGRNGNGEGEKEEGSASGSSGGDNESDDVEGEEEEGEASQSQGWGAGSSMWSRCFRCQLHFCGIYSGPPVAVSEPGGGEPGVGCQLRHTVSYGIHGRPVR